MSRDAPGRPHQTSRVVALVGNPNTGKTTLFNALTGFRQRVGNYPGVTVDKKIGYLRSAGDGHSLADGAVADSFARASGQPGQRRRRNRRRRRGHSERAGHGGFNGDSSAAPATPETEIPHCYRRPGPGRGGRGRSCHRGNAVEVIDLPGAYSLSAQSADEAVVLDVLLGRRGRVHAPDLIVAVADATDLSRSLFLISQVLELDRPVVVALTMTDLAQARGLRVDADALARELGVVVVPVVASREIGVDELIRAIMESFDHEATGRRVEFPACVSDEVRGLAEFVSSRFGGAGRLAGRAELLQVLLDPGGYHEARLLKQCDGVTGAELACRRGRIEAAGESVAEVEARVRYAWSDRVVRAVTAQVAPPRRSRSEMIDRVLTHRVLGLAILLLMMGVCFQSIYAWAAPIQEAIEGAIGWLNGLLTVYMPTGAVRSLLANGVLAGVGAVLTFLPQILILFLFLAILEDCGYMSRAAFLLDRWMNLLGLNGKSFIPLLSSFACAVPGIMATRTIEDRRDRFVTIMIAPLMSCSARLPIHTLLIAAFVPAVPLLGGLVDLRAVTLLAMYLVGVIVAVGVALILKRTILKGAVQPFLLVLPSYRWPSPKTVLFRVFEQGKVFCMTAGTLIFGVTVIVWALGYYPHPSSIAAQHEAQRSAAREAHAIAVAGITAGVQAEDSAALLEAAAADLESSLHKIDRSESGTYLRQSILGRLGKWVEPIVKPLGWDWRIGTAVIASFPAREVVIATMGTIYNLGEEQDEASPGLRKRLHNATWPDGRPVYNLAVALSIMVFFALCCQCGATLATIRRETNSWRWPMFTFAYMTLLAYAGALLTYQIVIRFI